MRFHPAACWTLAAMVVLAVAGSILWRSHRGSAAQESPGEKLRHLLNSPETDRLLPRPSERSAVLAFYRARNFSSIWTSRGALNDRGRAAVEVLSRSDTEGLDPGDYRIAPSVAPALTELGITAAVIRFARHIQFGRVDPGQVDPNIQFAHRPFDVAGLLNNVADSDDARAALDALAPPQPQYRALKAALARLRAGDSDAAASPGTSDRIPTVIANMERWRWFPRDLGSSNVVVNIPQYRLTLTLDGVPKFIARVIVGERALPTPVLSARMISITVNPTWNVPDGMTERELIPAMQKDSHLLDRLGLKADRRADGTLHVYQLPGDLNALGRLRFNFPNSFAVYQHDTPEQYLFDDDVRANSHGCVRIQNAPIYASYLLTHDRPNENFSPERIYALFGGDEVDFKLSKPIPVHLTYQSAYVDESGELALTRDIYGLDGKLRNALRREHDRAARPVREALPSTTVVGSSASVFRRFGRFLFSQILHRGG